MTSSYLSLDIIYLGLISDEVNFWFAGLGGSCNRNVNFWCIFWFLDQNVDQSLFFVLGLKRNYWSSWCWGTWGLDEDDFVVFLSLSNTDWSLWSEFFRLWRRNMNVDMFLDGGASTKTAAEAASKSSSRSAAKSSTKT